MVIVIVPGPELWSQLQFLLAKVTAEKGEQVLAVSLVARIKCGAQISLPGIILNGGDKNSCNELIKHEAYQKGD